MLGWGRCFPHLNPTRVVYTGVYNARRFAPPLVGQLLYSFGERSARLVCLAPSDRLDSSDLAILLDDMARQAGDWGAFHVMAGVEETSPALEGLRRSGFGVIAREHIWRCLPANRPAGDAKTSRWTPASSLDENSIRNLFVSLVPPMVQVAEPLYTCRAKGWVYVQDGELLAFAEAIHGPSGSLIQPLVHPAVENVTELIDDLLTNHAKRDGKPVLYCCSFLSGMAGEQPGKAGGRIVHAPGCDGTASGNVAAIRAAPKDPGG